MEYGLTQHASDALKRRQIPVAWMEQVLVAPEWTEPDLIDGELEHWLGRISDFQNRFLRVILNKSVKLPRIVTVYFDQGVSKP